MSATDDIWTIFSPSMSPPTLLKTLSHLKWPSPEVEKEKNMNINVYAMYCNSNKRLQTFSAF